MSRLFWLKKKRKMSPWFVTFTMSRVTLTFDVWIRVKVNVHHLNEDNSCTKLDGNPSMHM